CGMGGGVANGMTVPFLFRIRDHLKHKKVRLELFLATSEGHLGVQNVSEEKVERNCVASAMLWEQVMLGERTILYPGKEGVREDRRYQGPLQHRTWIFSGGAGNTTYSYPVIASIMANCIAALEMTRLGSYLDGDRVHYSEDILERTWKGAEGGKHPTALLAMNVAGLKADCLPALFHLRAVRRFLDAVTHSLPDEKEVKIREDASRCLAEAGLADEKIVETLGIGANPLTREEVREAHPPQERLHAYISERLEEDLGSLLRMAEGRGQPPKTGVLIERARLAISSAAMRVANGPDGYLPGAVLFYQTVQKQLEDQRQIVVDRANWARSELGSSPNRARLDTLLERLRRDTVPEDGHRPNMVERFVATLTVAVPTQTRKILEVSREIREHALVLGSAAVLCHVYESLAHFCEKQREELQGRLYVLNNAASICVREEELVQREARAAFTYQKARFAALVRRLWERLREMVALPDPSEVVDRLGGDLPTLGGNDQEVLGRLLEAIQPDAAQLAAAADEVMATEPLVRDALKESLAQFFPTIQVDRDRFPTLETARSRFVLCTRRMYEAHREDIFDGYHHLETDNPYNVLVSEHEEGIPFLALTYMYRIHEEFKAQHLQGRTSLAHAMACYESALPLLDF
ncbi:MAG: hypothetical protein ACE5G2_01630, partial [Candidatus Krumholzibacteriia bacterium]